MKQCSESHYLVTMETRGFGKNHAFYLLSNELCLFQSMHRGQDFCITVDLGFQALLNRGQIL